MKTLKSLRLVAASVLALGVTNAFAATTTDTFNVTASVVAQCTVSATDLVFGNYDPISLNNTAGANVDNSSTITATCTKGAATTVNVSNGGFNTLGGAARSMHFNDGVDDYYLNYDLYRGDYSTAWTDLVSTGTGAGVTTTVMGRVPKGQDATALAVGAYTDVLTVTVTF